MKLSRYKLSGLLGISCLFSASTSHAEELPAPSQVGEEAVESASSSGGGAEDLAMQLSNPVASLISVPIQSNFDFGIGPNDAYRWTTNIQPVIPISLTEDFNLISRTILPIIQAEASAPGLDDEFGLGDIVQSMFISPTSSDPIWDVGPVFLIPSATNDAFASDQFGIGPTAVILKQAGPWTFGALANHIWGVASSGEPDANVTFLQPFISYTTPDAWTYTVNAESTYDWNSEQWSIPVNAVVSKLVKIGDQPVSVFGGARYYAEGPDGGPEWGIRFGATLLFPK